MRRLNNMTTYFFVATNGTMYSVLMERLKNGTCGESRFKAYITNHANIISYQGSTKVYTFQGHYYNEIGEARYILEKTENVTLPPI